ncbi:MAG: GTP-binding protein [Bacteroidota bacterium]|nr:GTP-binding protein [Bacteroidota bacterium]
MNSKKDFNNNAYLDMELLRFTTAGSVDDGKSTLIGRLLYDSKSIFEDQLNSVKRASILKGNGGIDLSLLTDGLKAEREQGITIDVAYRYFATPKRKFIIADTPGHIQYTRNMVTGASTANVAIILIDARNGVIEQTFRHSYIASLLRIPHAIICINKMDLVDYDQEIYEKIKADYLKFSTQLNFQDIQFVPISALKGDNVVNGSENTPWYKEGSLRNILETIKIEKDFDFEHASFPVQYVIRPQAEKFHDFRGYAGRIAGGVFNVGDTVKILPSGLNSKIKSISNHTEKLEKAYPPMSVVMELEDDIDISRGDMIASENNLPQQSQDIEMMITWMSEKPLQLGKKYSLKHTTKDAKALIKEIEYKVDVNTMNKNYDDKEVKLNDIAKIKIKTTQPLFFHPYSKNRKLGSIILIEEGSNNTVGVGMIE